MKKLLISCITLMLAASVLGQQNNPLRVFIRSGPKTHGPGEHDHPRFLQDWSKLLSERGAKVRGKMGFPTAEELENTDVLVMYLAEGGTIEPADRANLEKYLQRGGGIVTLHDAICGKDPHWFKTVVGGAWEHGHSKWHEGEVGVYFLDTEHPITRGISNFDFKDEIYYDLHMMPEAKVLASSFHSVFVIAPQMWTYEKDNYRSFVWLAGHEYDSFSLPQVRAIILRGIAWAGKRQNVDLLCSKEELDSLKYPPGGPTAPEKAAATMNLHPEFEINLVASEPLLEKAISLDWDPQGRLWVAETPEYPGGRTINKNDAMVALWAHSNPESVAAGEVDDRKPKDRISWLEDTNGDGQMDKRHVFAEGLELVTSLVFYRDGVIVAQAPHILWLRDKDGDGKCNMEDERVVLYTGFGTFDTHAVINNFRWGMDGWIYSAIGYSAGNPVSPDGSKNFGRVTAGIIRFKPDGSALEQVASGSCNTWGFDFAPDGEAFYTTATCGEHLLHVVMPENLLAKGNIGGVRSSAVIPDHQDIKPAVKHTRPAYVQIDWVGKFTAAAGCCIYNGGAWPEKYNGSHFCSETTMSLVHHELIKPNGVTYLATKEPGREETEFIAGTDLWFRPIHTRVGPDGALYVIDFYNQAAIHNDTRGPKHGARNAAVRPDRDHHFGRVWRVQHKEAKKFEAPRLNKASEADLVKALDHPNGWTRQTAQRLLVEKGNQQVLPALEKFALDGKTSAYGKVQALWTSYLLSKKHNPELLTALYTSKDEAVSKAAMQLLRNYPIPAAESGRYEKLYAAMREQLRNPQGRIRLETLMAISASEEGDKFASSLWNAYAGLNDAWTESALVGILSRDPERAILQAAELDDPKPTIRTVRALAERIANAKDAESAARVLVGLAGRPAAANPIKQAVLESFSRNLTEDAVAPWNNQLAAAFRALLKANESVATAALPLIARWDRNATLSAELRPIIDPLMARVNDPAASVEQRAQAAAGLLGLRQLNPRIVPTVVDLLKGDAPVALKRQVTEALGNVADAEIGKRLVEAFPDVQFELRDPVFAQITKRSEWSELLLKAVQQEQITLNQLGPALLHRLRTHPDAKVAQRANQVIDEIRGPETQEKDALVQQFAAAVQEKGDVAKGRELYTQNCANCHRFNNEGRDVAPDLTGMGAHGPLDLLLHIVDPNRVVEPNFVTVSIETKDELTYDGIIARENQSTLVLRNATGDYEIRQEEIKSRKSTGMSLMPNGFEALGKEGLRDLISYLCEDEGNYRVLDLSDAFTADSTKGIFHSKDVPAQVNFRKFGLIPVDGVPFDVMSPSRTRTGKNLIVLKGGQGFALTLPEKTEANVEATANRLHFLGGVGGWAFPCCGENQNENMPVMKVTVHFADGTKTEIVLRNGVEFADYIGKFDVPGSKEAQGLVRSGQMRWFTKDLGRTGKIEKLTFESYNNTVVPVLAAVTAELAGEGHGTVAETKVSSKGSKGSIKALIVGGGTHHDFGRWFNEADTKTLERDGLAEVEYTEDISSVLPRLDKVDVLYLCNNQPLKDRALREAIFKFVNAGKGLVLVHPALWYNWEDWPEYNAQLVGGGARSHDKYGEFEVHITAKDHPLTKGVPSTFTLKDELYHVQKDPKGAAIQPLVAGNAPGSSKSYPVLWVTEHPKGRIVCLTLGHDGESHNHPAFQTLLRNAMKWAARRE